MKVIEYLGGKEGLDQSRNFAKAVGDFGRCV